MVPPQDALITLPHVDYGQYLRLVYSKMAAHVPPDAVVAEVGVRPEDREVLSRAIIPHRRFLAVDRNPRRGQVVQDVLVKPLTADVILSTCVLHHTLRGSIPRLLGNLQAPLLMLSGPNAAVLHDLFGDHQWHLEQVYLENLLGALGYETAWERVGMTEPYCELLVIARMRT